MELVRGLCSRLGGSVGDEVSGGGWAALWEVGEHCGTLFQVRGHYGRLKALRQAGQYYGSCN